MFSGVLASVPCPLDAWRPHNRPNSIQAQRARSWITRFSASSRTRNRLGWTAPRTLLLLVRNSGSLAAMKKYVCSVCGHIYDPAVGEPESGIAPGTPFEAIPETWRCPDCGMEKSAFTELTE